jgi:beta-lactam-binding protein with PASTA domain
MAALLFAVAEPALADTVPDVVGLRLDEARAMVGRAGFSVRADYEASQPAGLVFSQQPGGLADRPRGTGVTLRVGGEAPPEPAPQPPPAAPEPAPTPSRSPDLPPLEGPPPSGTGPATDWPLPPPSVATPGGTAPARAAPTPAPSASGPALDPLTASATPEELPNRVGPPLPNVLRRTEAEARAALSAWALDVEVTLSMPELVGRVVNQAPTPGDPLAHGERVTVVVGLASLPSIDHHVVPVAEGLPVAEAKARIEREGFRAVLRSLPSPPELSGRVIHQSPLPVSLGVKGSDVVLRVGRGGHAGGVPATGPIRTPPVVPPDLGAPPAGTHPETPPQPVPGTPFPPAPGTPIPLTPPAPGPGPTVPPGPTPMPPGPAPQPGTPVPPGTPKPGTPQPIGPAEGSTFPRAYGATFQWTSVPGAGHYEWELQEEQTGSTWRTVATTVVKETRHRPPRMERGRFRWRVRAITDAGGASAPGEWSPFFRLWLY